MTDTTLPSEVAEAIKYVDGIFDDADNGEWSTVRNHLHRLAEENARLTAEVERLLECNGILGSACDTDFARAQYAEANLNALKARIAEARRVMLGTYPAHGSGYVQIVCDPTKGIGDEVFALLKLEDGE